MSDLVFSWCGQPVSFRQGESVATALFAAGVTGYGPDVLGGDTRYFCGIGACQACLVQVHGRPQEACLTPARPGLRVEPLKNGAADHARS